MAPAPLRGPLTAATNQAEKRQPPTGHAACRFFARRVQHRRHGDARNAAASEETAVGELCVDNVQEVDKDAVERGGGCGASRQAIGSQQGRRGLRVVDHL